MAQTSSEEQVSLEAAYPMLFVHTGHVTIAALQEATKFSPNTAQTWLKVCRAKERAAARATQQVAPPEPLATVVDAIRAHLIDAVSPAALIAARAEVAQKHTAELAEARISQQVAEDDAASARQLAAVIGHRADAAGAELTAAQAALADLRAMRDGWVRDPNKARAGRPGAEAELARRREVELAELTGELTVVRAALAVRSKDPA